MGVIGSNGKPILEPIVKYVKFFLQLMKFCSTLRVTFDTASISLPPIERVKIELGSLSIDSQVLRRFFT